jgi:hypothetical protein
LTPAQLFIADHLGKATGRKPRGILDALTAAISQWRPDAVITATGRPSSSARYLIRVLGPPTVSDGKVLGWRL